MLKQAYLRTVVSTAFPPHPRALRATKGHRAYATSARLQRRNMASTSSNTSTEAPTTPSTNKFKFAAIQMKCTADKIANLENAYKLIKEAAANGAHLIALPVCTTLIASRCANRCDLLRHIDQKDRTVGLTFCVSSRSASIALMVRNTLTNTLKSLKKMYWPSSAESRPASVSLRPPCLFRWTQNGLHFPCYPMPRPAMACT